LYRVRLRARLLQESFAVLGIAAGVALLFASQVATESLSSSVAHLSRAILGDATLQLRARDPHGFDERLLARVRGIPGVRVAAPLMEANANISGPRGSRSAELIGADASLALLGGSLVAHTELAPFGGIGAIVLPAPLARGIGVTKFGAEATLEVGGHVSRAPLYSQLAAGQVGGLIDSPVVLAPLSFAQEMAGRSAHITRVLVAPRRGRETVVRAALGRLAGGRLDVESAGYDEALFAKAAAASNQSTLLFAVISALVGFLFAFNAMLLTVPERRRLIADLRRDGYTPRAVIGVLLLDALMLGGAACVVGLALGEELSIHLFRSDTGFLSSAFAVGSARVVGLKSIVLAALGGMLAATLAVLSPMRDILSRDPLAAVTPVVQGSRRGWGDVLVGGGLLCLMLAASISWAAPQLAILGMISLMGALLLLLPRALEVTLVVVGRLARMLTGVVLHVATMELRAARARAVAVAATGAFAVFGSVSIQGAHGDLQHGLENAARDMNSFTDLWVSPTGAFDLLMTQPFAAATPGRLEALPGVNAVRIYRGGLLDWGERRIWVIAPPGDARPVVPPSQILDGDARLASQRIRRGGWAILSLALAYEHHLRIGQAFTLPGPQPTVLRLAAISTNIGWAPGAAIVNAVDFAHAWRSADPSAYNVLLAPGVSPAQVRREIEKALGPSSGLTVQSAAQHAERQRALARQGLVRLSQIATLILAVAVLAMAAAIAAMIWQRRPRLAKLKLEGFSREDLWATLMLESLLLLGVGCAAGGALGLLGQQLLDRALSEIVNYPVVQSVAFSTAFGSLLVVSGAGALILAGPSYAAARVPAGLALREE
jgi:putative ABC transport system permease protein